MILNRTLYVLAIAAAVVGGTAAALGAIWIVATIARRWRPASAVTPQWLADHEYDKTGDRRER